MAHPPRTYGGIDVALARGKRLPVCVAVPTARGLGLLPLRDLADLASPRGRGNAATLDADLLNAYADEVAAYLRAVEARFGVAIRRIAIDAPRDVAPNGGRRAAESARSTPPGSRASRRRTAWASGACVSALRRTCRAAGPSRGYRTRTSCGCWLAWHSSRDSSASSSASRCTRTRSCARST